MKDLDKISEFIQHRKKEITTTKRLVSMLQDSSDFSASKLVSSIAKELPESTPVEAIQALNAMSSIIAEVNNEIPDRVKSKTYAEDIMFSKFSSMVQQIMLSPDVSSNVEGMVSASAKSMAKEVESLTSDVKSLREDAEAFLSEFKSIVDSKKPANSTEKIGKAKKDIEALILEAKNKTSELQSRILSGKDFSKFRTEDLTRVLTEIREAVPTKGIEYMFVDQSVGIVENAGKLRSAVSELGAWKDRLQGMKSSIRDQIKPGDIFNKNFSQMYKTFESMLNSTKGINPSIPEKSLAMLGSIKSNSSALSGIISSLGNTNIKNKLDDISSEANLRTDKFLNDVKNFELPIEELKGIEYNMKAMVKTAEKYVAGTLKPKVQSILDTMESNMTKHFNKAESMFGEFKSLLTTFDPPLNADMTAFMDSVGRVAPAARDAMLQGNIENFKKTLESPMFLTSAGAAVESLKKFTETAKSALTVADSNMVNIVSSYLSGEHKRAMMSMWISNISGQRSAALKSLDGFVANTLTPVDMMLQTLKRKFQGV